jgi:cyclophilin family peptidyl-prolyl cis-trans isomerase
MLNRFSIPILSMVILFSSGATRADDPVPAKGPAGQKFTQLFTAWEKLFEEVEAVRKQYGTASDAEKPPLMETFSGLRNQIEKMAPTVALAAKQAYIESPNTDEDATKMVIGMAAGACRRDDYEEAAGLVKLLLENGCTAPELYDAAGIAAFCTNDFAAAAKYLEMAREAKTISRQGGQFLSLCPDYTKFWEVEQSLRAKEAKADDLPRVKLETNKGDIVIELLENEAPKAVANFVHLVSDGYYDGLTFHRVLPNFMAQGGCPTGTGSGGPGYNIPCECYGPDHRKHFRGSLSMAHAGRDTGGSQFFLTFIPTSHLNGKHTVFGRVVEGMDVLAKIQRRDPDPRTPGPKAEPDKITKATVLRKRDHKYEPTKVPE